MFQKLHRVFKLYYYFFQSPTLKKKKDFTVNKYESNLEELKFKRNIKSQGNPCTHT